MSNEIVSMEGGGSSEIDIERLHDLPSTCAALTMTARHDAGDRPFLYVASKSGGLRIYHMVSKPALVRTITVRDLASLEVMSVSQSGTRLFLALGNHFGPGQSPGLAVVDVRDPARAAVSAIWRDAAVRGGAGIVEAAGKYAYLGAMGNGLVILDVSAEGQIREVSRLVPDIRFPDRNPDPRKYNARGMALRNDLIYLCYDAGGLRIIDVSDKTRPVEIGRYSNPAMNGKPRAYNNVVLNGTLAYVAVDYVGMEILDISNPQAISLVSWWNPWNPNLKPFQWFNSPGHANEIALDPHCALVFLSVGKSDLQVVGVSDPARPELRASFGSATDTEGTWGVSIHKERVYLSYICTLGIPFRSNWTGVRVLRYSCGGLP